MIVFPCVQKLKKERSKFSIKFCRRLSHKTCCIIFVFDERFLATSLISHYRADTVTRFIFKRDSERDISIIFPRQRQIFRNDIFSESRARIFLFTTNLTTKIIKYSRDNVAKITFKLGRKRAWKASNYLFHPSDPAER